MDKKKTEVDVFGGSTGTLLDSAIREMLAGELREEGMEPGIGTDELPLDNVIGPQDKLKKVIESATRDVMAKSGKMAPESIADLRFMQDKLLSEDGERSPQSGDDMERLRDDIMMNFRHKLMNEDTIPQELKDEWLGEVYDGEGKPLRVDSLADLKRYDEKILGGE